jgi:hypothetical protein
LREVEGSADLYLVGGFDDDRSISLNVLRQVLSFYMECAAVLELKLAYIGPTNTRVELCSKPYSLCNTGPRKGATGSHTHRLPKILGAAFSPHSRVLSPAIFSYRGPMVEERQARCLTSGQCSDIYDASAKCFVVKPWQFALDDSSVSALRQLLALRCLHPGWRFEA